MIPFNGNSYYEFVTKPYIHHHVTPHHPTSTTNACACPSAERGPHGNHQRIAE